MRKNQSAFTLLTTIFLLVVLSVLGAYMLSLRNVQQQTVVSGLQGSRAIQAANSGLEWGVFLVLNSANCGALPSPPQLVFTNAGLNGFRVNVSCESSNHIEGSVSIEVYSLEAFAQYSDYGRPEYVSRRLRMTVSANPP